MVYNINHTLLDQNMVHYNRDVNIFPHLGVGLCHLTPLSFPYKSTYFLHRRILQLRISIPCPMCYCGQVVLWSSRDRLCSAINTLRWELLSATRESLCCKDVAQYDYPWPRASPHMPSPRVLPVCPVQDLTGLSFCTLILKCHTAAFP